MYRMYPPPFFKGCFRRETAWLRGVELADALDAEDWDESLIDAMQVFNEVDADQQQFILASVKDTLHLKSVHTSRQISKYLSRIGFALMILAATVAVLGFYLPLAGAASNVTV